MRQWGWLVSAAAVLALASSGRAVVHNCSSVIEFQAALAGALPGDEIRLAYGVYAVTDAQDHKHWFQRSGTAADPIRIIGQFGPNGERPVFDATGANIDRGIFYMWEYASHYVIENLEFRNARCSTPNEANAAAAYIYGGDITFRNCYSHHNDNGFSSASAMVGDATFENCEIAWNGKLPGATGSTTHNLYLGGGHTITVRNCHIHHSTEGQNYKSRARSNYFAYNYVHDDANYAWEIASGNDLNSLMIGNVIIKAPDAESHKIIGLSDGVASSGTLTMINNTIVATYWLDYFFNPAAASSTSVVMYNNIFAGPSKLLTQTTGSVPMSGSHNWFHAGANVPAGVTNSLFGYDPHFVNPICGDYRLLPSTPCKDAGTSSLQWLTPQYTYEAVTPAYEPLPLLAPAARPVDAALDMGAFEALPAAPPLTGTSAAATFNDDTLGDLDAIVEVSARTADGCTVGITNLTHGLPDADKEMYITFSYGSGNDRAILDGDNLYGDVAVSGVVGLWGNGLRSGGAGVIAGSLTGAGTGYMLYIVNNWGDSRTWFYDYGLGSGWQLVLARKDAAVDYPLSGGASTFRAVRISNFVQDFPYFLRLTVDGTQIKGEAWFNKTSAEGDPNYTLTLTDPTPLAGYAGVYLCGRNCSSTTADWGKVAVDDFQAVSAAPLNYTLATSVQGQGGVTPQGSVELSPPGGSYPAGTTVQLTAVPTSEHWQFLRWEGGLSGPSNPASLVLNANTAVTAVFGKIGDIDEDGAVNVFDIFAIAECWNTQTGDPTFNPAADLDGDGAINVFDIFTIAEHWNS